MHELTEALLYVDNIYSHFCMCMHMYQYTKPIYKLYIYN